MPRIRDTESDNRFWHNTRQQTNITDQVSRTTAMVPPLSGGSLRGRLSPFGVPGDRVEFLSVDRLITGTLGVDNFLNINDKAGLSAFGTTAADIRIWAGDTHANRAIAPFRVNDAGQVTASLFATGTDVSILDFQFDGTFSATDNDTIAWTSGTLTFSSGESFAIGAGNTGNMSALTYIYFDKNVSGTVLQTTTTAANASGADIKIIAAAENVTNTDGDATVQVYGGSGGLRITGDLVSRFSLARNRQTIAFDANRIPNRFADFEQYVLGDTIGVVTNGTATSSDDEVLIGTKVLKMVASAPDSFVYLGSSNSDYNTMLDPNTKYLVSFYAKGAAGGEQIDAFIRQDNGTFLTSTPSTQDITTSWERYTFEFTTDGSLTDSGLIRIDNDDNGATIYIDAVQVEEASDADTPEPSGWKPGATSQIHVNNLIGGVGIQEVTALSTDTDSFVDSLTADGDTYTFTYNFNGELATMNDGVSTYTVNRTNEGILSTITIT